MDEALQQDLKQLLELAEKYGLEELSVASGQEELRVVLDPEGFQFVPSGGAGPKHAEPAEEEAAPDWTPVASPLLGTFYRKPAPEAPPFVEPGDEVEPDTVIGLVEAMKVFNEVTADVKGRVARVAVGDATLVQPGDVLLWVEEG